MVSTMQLLISLYHVTVLFTTCDAFVVRQKTLASFTRLYAESEMGRRDFAVALLSASVTASLLQPTTLVLAIEDLDMPVEPEPTKLDEAAMAERLRKKAALQQKTVAPKTLSESFQSERSKQKEMKDQTKVERRNAMCEELGRGC